MTPLPPQKKTKQKQANKHPARDETSIVTGNKAVCISYCTKIPVKTTNQTIFLSVMGK